LSPRCQSVPTSEKPAARSASTCTASRPDGEPWCSGGEYRRSRGWAAGCATGLAIAIGSDLCGRLGVCTADRCDRVYVDTSKNGTRRFCSTTCQNRVKSAAFRARQS